MNASSADTWFIQRSRCQVGQLATPNAVLGESLEQLSSLVGWITRSEGKGLFTDGVAVPMALPELGLIDVYEFVTGSSLVAAAHAPCGINEHGLHRPSTIGSADAAGALLEPPPLFDSCATNPRTPTPTTPR